MGPISPARWHATHRSLRIGATSLLKVGVAAGTEASPATAPTARRARPTEARDGAKPGKRPQVVLDMESSFSIALGAPHGEGQQHVAGQPAEEAITGVDVHDSVHDGGPGGIERAALALHAVDRLVLAHGVEVPEHAAVRRGVRAQVAV